MTLLGWFSSTFSRLIGVREEAHQTEDWQMTLQELKETNCGVV